MTLFDTIKRQIDEKRKQIAALEKTARQTMKLYGMIQELVELAETLKPDVKTRRDIGWIGWHAFLNDFCTVSIAVPRQFGKTTALMQWGLTHKNCLVWLPQGSYDRIMTECPVVKGNHMIEENFFRMYRGTKKQIDYLLIDEYHAGKTDSLVALQGAILSQNLSANKEDQSFITIKVGTPR